MRRPPAFLMLAFLAWAGMVRAAETTPAPYNLKGHNIHVVQADQQHLFLRGGAPTAETMQGLIALAKQSGLPLILVDLRTPARPYDNNGEGGRLTPAKEKAMSLAAGFTYQPVSALDKNFGPQLVNLTQAPGIVYMHCQYGVNRTGFAVGRYEKLTKKGVDRTGLGERDFNQGFAYQK